MSITHLLDILFKFDYLSNYRYGIQQRIKKVAALNNFATLLRQARQEAGLTQKELADAVGVDHSYISKIERAVYDPPARDKVLAIADTLNIQGAGERVLFFLSAGCASLGDLESLDRQKQLERADANAAPFSSGAFFFPRTDELEEDSLIEEIRTLLRNSLSLEQRIESIRLLRSFVSWLRFQVGNDDVR